MAEVNKELLRKLALEWIAASEKVDTTDDDDDFLEFNAIDEVWQVEASGDTVLSLLDENAAQDARIAELERECERLRKQVEKCVAKARSDHQAINDVLSANWKLRNGLLELRNHSSMNEHQIETIDAYIAGSASGELYECQGKGGVYEKIGYAKPAGALKNIHRDSGIVIYRDDETGQLYFRDPGDFRRRMVRIDAAMQEGGV
ncbi:hypothetical protein [Metapseudomonas otitidis]|uniref:hypothetical protein n=1 Tax=Metapseudomonas otitidis TaxID=319939 RepID=UPI002448C1B3|nr:hypothetical protein [Pseudomonas otitidis]MDH0335164.1 hypothetical protein [Pseudomonas otitidis]